MSQRIQINGGYTQVAMPDGRLYDGPTEVVLSDEEFADIDADAFTSGMLTDLGGSGAVVTVDAGTALDAARPEGAGSVYWRFDSGVDVGADGVNIVNVEPGDTWFVADA